jgi:hypothetical protein
MVYKVYCVEVSKVVTEIEDRDKGICDYNKKVILINAKFPLYSRVLTLLHERTHEVFHTVLRQNFRVLEKLDGFLEIVDDSITDFRGIWRIIRKIGIRKGFHNWFFIRLNQYRYKK